MTTFNKYFTALYRWILASDALITVNIFVDSKVIEEKNITEGRKSYTPIQLKGGGLVNCQISKSLLTLTSLISNSYQVTL
jgi:hypothetical protein